MPEPEKKKACDCADRAMIIISNAPTPLIKGGSLPFLDRDGKRLSLFAVRDDVKDITVYIHPEALVDVIWEPKPPEKAKIDG